MSETARARETEEFATLLREFKDRSGLSYGALAKRLHMSTSTLHRYCNGTALPNEYASVERLARVCRATPQELVELHRRWILADEARRRRADQSAPPPHPATDPAPGTQPADATPPTPTPTPEPDPAPAPGPAATATPASPDQAEGVEEADQAEKGHQAEEAKPTVPAPVTVLGAPHPTRPPRRARTALIASAGVAALLGAVALIAPPPWGAGGDDARDRQAAGATAGGPTDAERPAATPSPSGRSRTPSASASASASAPATGSGAAQGTGEQGAAADPTGDNGSDSGNGTNAAPLNVDTRPYVYDSPCSQHFLVDSEPAQVGPPAPEQDAPRWAAAYGAVSSDEQRIALTVQGTGADTVVLHKLHVRVVTKGTPLAWNDYSMGVGCGGNVETKSFDVDLDEGSPTVTVKNGQSDFPYQVSESDPEVFYVTAHTKAHDVRWYLTLDWSSGARRGTVRIDDRGTLFRTSANAGRPGYDYPLGSSDWIKRES